MTLALLLVLLAVTAHAEKAVPFLAGRVNDLPHLLPEAARARLEQKLADLETRTGAQVVVLIVDSLEGDSLEGYSLRVVQTWKPGRKGVDDGVLLLVATQDRKMRIEVGYGLEFKLTDLVSRQILDDRMRPAFRQGDFAGGIEAGVDAIGATIEGAAVPPAPAAARWTRWLHGLGVLGDLLVLGTFLVHVGMLSIVAVLMAGQAGWVLYCILIPFYFFLLRAPFGRVGGILACGAWIVLFPILRTWIRPGDKDFAQRHPRWAIMSAPGHSGSGGHWRSGGGGFSGGGGSFGGGGSSGSW